MLELEKRFNILSAGEEPAGFGHLVSDFPLRAQVPGQGCEADNDAHEDGGVGAPVGGLGVPATARRPDVLGVSVRRWDRGLEERLFSGSIAQACERENRLLTEL